MQFRQAIWAIGEGGLVRYYLDGVEVPAREFLEYQDEANADLVLSVLNLAERVESLCAHQASLEEKIGRQRKALSELNEATKAKSMALDAHHHVWCSAGCIVGAHRFAHSPELPEVTEKLVREAERNTGRLRQWFESRKAGKDGAQS